MDSSGSARPHKQYILPPLISEPEFPEWERATDRVCLDYANGVIVAFSRLVDLGFPPEVVQEGLCSA